MPSFVSTEVVAADCAALNHIRGFFLFSDELCDEEETVKDFVGKRWTGKRRSNVGLCWA